MALLEIETKYPVTDHAPFLAQIQKWGAKKLEDREDSDLYFNAPDRDFASTDEAFRLRRIGERNCLTYKGPKRDLETKTRLEIEVPFADGSANGEDLARLLQHLGYRSVAVVHKFRTVYELIQKGYHLHVCFDDVTEVGKYLEVEIVAEEAEFEKAKKVLLEVAAEMGLKESERRSYLSMLLGKKKI